MFEALAISAALLTAAAASPPPDAKPTPSKAPPAELLEFIGDWSEEEAQRFLSGEGGAQKVSDGGGSEPPAGAPQGEERDEN